MSKDKPDYRPKCDGWVEQQGRVHKGSTNTLCKNKAAFNFQRVWVEYKCLRNGHYTQPPTVMDDQDPSGDDNLHYCNCHAEAYRNDGGDTVNANDMKVEK